MSVAAAGALLAATVGVALWLAGGVGGLLYAHPFALAVAPGLPLGFALFGRRHPAAWVAGSLIGYGLTQLSLWAVIAADIGSPMAFVVAWLVLLVAAVLVSRTVGTVPAAPAAAWTTIDIRALLLVALLVPVLMGVTYRNLGRQDADGNRYYRAYFTADFLWHTALAHELGKFSLPPRNPYLAPRPMNYYWTYFLLPATVARVCASSVPQMGDVQRCLKANAILVGLLMVGALFVLVRSAVSSAGVAVAAVILAVLAASAEGLYAIVDIVSHGRLLSHLQDINIDAVTGWPPFGGLRIDNMPRSLWYTPQHTTSIALGLVGLTIAIVAGAGARPAAISGAGLALGLSTTMSPLLGAVCSLIYGACIIADGIRRGRPAAIARHSIAALFVIAAVVWGASSRVMDGASAALDVGFSGFSRRYPVITLLLSLGPVLLPALPGVWRPRSDTAFRAVVVGSTGILTGLFLLYFVRISEASWVGFRAGQILLVTIPILLARTLEQLQAPARHTLAALILLVGLPTTAIDAWNTQDIGNRRPGPGFRWTLWTTPDQEDAFSWIRQNTTDDAIVQMEPIVRGREHWTLIPSFAGRRMAAGLPISLLPLPEYTERSEVVRRIFETGDAGDASALARRLRLDYLYVDQDDVAAYPSGTLKFDEHPTLFEPVFTNPSVRVYRVR
jgi:hypothetical protein